MTLKGYRFVCKDFFVSIEPFVKHTGLPQNSENVLCSYVISGVLKFNDKLFYPGEWMEIPPELTKDKKRIFYTEDDGYLCCFFLIKKKKLKIEILKINDKAVVEENKQIFVIEGTFNFEDKTINKYELMVEKQHPVTFIGNGTVAKITVLGELK